jgi:hypothetical protein
MRVSFSTILLLSIFMSTSASQTNENLNRLHELNSKKWQLIKLYETTEDALIMSFGTPDLVTMHYTYEELVKANSSKTGLDISGYIFEYGGTRGNLHILKGPLGEARSAKVWIVNSKVVEVDWEYAGPYRDGAEASWNNDASIETLGRKLGERQTILGVKKLLNGSVLYIDCFADNKADCSDAIEVRLMREVASGK